MTREWGCPKCQHPESWVIDTARDQEGYIVRLRRCARCMERWGTQELPLAAGSYWTRAYSRNQARLALTHKKLRACTKCGATYHAGRYLHHASQSRRHEASLMETDRNRVKARHYQREYARKHA